MKTIIIPHECAWEYESPPELLKDILKMSLVSKSNRVRKLYLSQNICTTQIEMLEPYLCVESSSMTPYGGLHEIEVYSIGKQSRKVKHNLKRSTSGDNLLQMLTTLIRNQKQLSKVRLQGKFPATSSCDALMVALADLVSKPSVEEVNLVGEEGSEVNLGPFSQLLVSYLFSPATNEQQLILHGFKFSKSMTRSQLPLGEYSVIEGQNKKSLVLSWLDVSPLVPQLLQVPPVVLKCVELSSSLTLSTGVAYIILLVIMT